MVMRMPTTPTEKQRRRKWSPLEAAMKREGGFFFTHNFHFSDFGKSSMLISALDAYNSLLIIKNGEISFK